MTTTPEMIRRPAGTKAYADTRRHIGIFGFPSTSGTEEYKIGWDVTQECWVCSCKGGINYGRCKHLEKVYNRRPHRADLMKMGAAAIREADAIDRAEREKEARQRLKERPTRDLVPPNIRLYTTADLDQRARIEPAPRNAPVTEFTTTRVRRLAAEGEV